MSQRQAIPTIQGFFALIKTDKNKITRMLGFTLFAATTHVSHSRFLHFFFSALRWLIIIRVHVLNELDLIRNTCLNKALLLAMLIKAKLPKS